MHSIRAFFARAAAVAAIVVVAPLLTSVPSAVAASESDITWSVSPADASGPDGRGVIEHELDPGRSTQDFLAVKNLSRSEVTFSLSAADGYYTDKGRFNMLPSDQKSVDAGSWIQVQDSVTVGPNATVVVPFDIHVPDDALPGDHAAGIAASIVSAGTDATGSQVGVESRVGFRVMTRVTGDIVSAFEMTGTGSSYDLSWNPFQPGSASVSFEIRNTGNTSLVVNGEVRAGSGERVFPGDDAARQELLPGESRSFTVVVADVWPTVYVPATVSLAPTSYDVGGAVVAVAPASTQLVVWAIPVPQLLVLIGVALLLIALLWRRRRFRAALAAAREEGRIAASSGPHEPTPPAETPTLRARRVRA